MHTAQAHLAGAPSTSRLDTCENHAAAAALTLRALIDAYMAEYAGRDPARVYRLESWQAQLGARLVTSLTDDDVFAVLEQFAAAPARIYMGKDADGRPIHRAKGKRAPGTVNRYRDALSAVFAWAICKRRVPKSFDNPCSKVHKHPERPGVIRFLDAGERARLLAACEAAPWPRLYGPWWSWPSRPARGVASWSACAGAMWISNGASRILEGKNGEAKVLPLTAAVLAELGRFREQDAGRFKLALPSQLVFDSNQKPDVAFNFEGQWRAALQVAQVKHFRFHDLRHYPRLRTMLSRWGSSTRSPW